MGRYQTEIYYPTEVSYLLAVSLLLKRHIAIYHSINRPCVISVFPGAFILNQHASEPSTPRLAQHCLMSTDKYEVLT